MGLRKASAYSKKKVRPYTRKSAKRSKAFIKAVPQNKIVKFNMGSAANFVRGAHPFIVKLLAIEKVQIRDNALEACRMMINKSLDRAMQGNYYFVVKVFPHHILRENKSAGGMAGADRLSHGMKHSFGVTIGRAAIVHPGKEIFVVTCTDEKSARAARTILGKARSKIPCRSKIVFQRVG